MSRPAAAPIAEANRYAVAGIEIAVDDVDHERLLERPLVPFLVEAHLQRLDSRRALPRNERACRILRRDVVGGRRIAGLEQAQSV